MAYTRGGGYVFLTRSGEEEVSHLVEAPKTLRITETPKESRRGREWECCFPPPAD